MTAKARRFRKNREVCPPAVGTLAGNGAVRQSCHRFDASFASCRRDVYWRRRSVAFAVLPYPAAHSAAGGFFAPRG